MGKVYDAIDDKLATWIDKQHLFFVATAPLSGEGLVNCSPKGLDAFTILAPHTVAYLDLTGSGVETIAHLRENGRITILFCAFDAPGGETFRSRIPTSVPMPTLTPAESASIHSRTGTAQRMIATTRNDPTRKIALTAATPSMDEPRLS